MKVLIACMLIYLLPINHLIAQPSPEPAEKILKEACLKASLEKKNVMIIFTASWCGWCRKLDASIKDTTCNSYFDRSFVIEHLTVLEHNEKKAHENPGASELYKKHSGDNAGIPFFLFFDPTGKLITDSKMKSVTPKNEERWVNIGCPTSTEEIEVFIEKLNNISKLTENETTSIMKRFNENRVSK
jgi:thioredoxin-related protein